jgi:hypothetical protein
MPPIEVSIFDDITEVAASPVSLKLLPPIVVIFE